jgi:hypothetical protein
MEVANSMTTNGGRLAWAVLAQTPTGRSEVIKVTDHADADRTIQDNPGVYYKAGPFILT